MLEKRSRGYAKIFVELYEKGDKAIDVFYYKCDVGFVVIDTTNGLKMKLFQHEVTAMLYDEPNIQSVIDELKEQINDN